MTQPIVGFYNIPERDRDLYTLFIIVVAIVFAATLTLFDDIRNFYFDRIILFLPFYSFAILVILGYYGHRHCFEGVSSTLELGENVSTIKFKIQQIYADSYRVDLILDGDKLFKNKE